jgi:hypothetical protein
MTRVVAIMQPTYLPYLGYFDLVNLSDTFVFLDDVQFERRSWQSRNRINPVGGVLMLTVPVKKHSQDTLIRDIEIADDQPWREKHLASIRHAYGGRPHFADGWAFIEGQLTAERGPLLADLTCGLTEAAVRKMGLDTRIVRSGTLGCEGRRSDRLLAICRALGATEYLSTIGSKDYIDQEQVFAQAGLPVRYKTFTPIPFPQGRPEFTPYMSFVDALMNVGWEGIRGLLAGYEAQLGSGA